MNETNHPFLVGSRGLTGSSSFSQASEIRTSAAPFSSTGATRRIFTPIQDISDTSEKKTGKLRLSFVTASDQEKFEELFRSAVGDSIVISGEIAKSIMSKSCLTPSVLSKIWEHADTTKSGQLMMPEFVLAMHLCNMAMSGKSVPDKIPDVIYDEVFDVVSSILLSVPDSVPSNINTTNLKTVSTSQHTASSLPTTQTVKPLQMSQTSVVAQAGGPQTHFLQLPTNFQSFSSSSNVRPPVHHTPLHYMESVEPSLTGVLNYPAQFKNIVSQEQWGIIDRNQGKLSGIDALQSQLMPRKGKEGFSALNLHANTQLTWAITKEEKQVYDNIFKAWDGYNIGFINGQTAVEIFSQSGLSKKDLELIWNLADSDNSGKLNIDEFSIALHLIYRKLNGYEIPLELPQELMLQSSKNFSESVNQVKSLLRDFNSQQKQSFSPNVTDYMKSSSPFINDPFQLYRKETSTYKYDDNKIGYIPVSRRKEPLKDFDSPFIHTEQKELLVQSNKNIKNKEGNLDITNIQNEKHELKIKNEIKHLYRQIRYIQEEIDNHPESSLLLYDLEEEHKTLTEELQDLSEELPSIISKIRKVEQEIANAKIELFKLRDAKNHPDSAEKFKNNKTANTDKRETKTAVILKAQMAILTGKSTLLEDNDYEKRYTEALFHINKERQSNENTISNIEESAEQLKNDLKSKLKDFQDKFLQNNYERKKWNKGIDIQNEEVRKFILDLEKTRESQEKKDLDHFKKNQFLDTSIEQSKVNPSKTEYSEFTYKNDTANAFISIDKNKDKAAWIKAEAERRMNERLAEMGIEPYKRSSRSDNFLTINKTQINDIKETEKKKENKELEKDTENSLGINKFKKIDMYQAQQNLTEDSALDQQSEILNEAFQKEKELLSEKEAQEERIKKLKVIKLKNVEKAYEIKRREKKHDLFEKEKKLRKLKEEMENKKQEELLLQRKQAEMEEEIKKLSLENEKYEIEENKNKLKADSIQTQHISRTNPFLQFSTSESFTSLNKPNNPFSNMQSHNKSNSSLNTLYTTSSVQLCSSPPIISVLKASHSDCQTDSNNWSTSQYTYESDSSDDSVIAKKSPAQLASILFGNIEANKKSPQASKSDISKSPITKLDMSPSPLPTPPPLPTNINSSSIVNRHALLNQIQKGTKLKKTPTIHPRSSSIVGKVL
ncbi:hypothetical protein PNEG_02644 [Pneumocystis murina B123]|uniref:Actin cytoskeleton-regulatory complex protein PAN1 n=1 Tax=Pneumocystis murina (strain B123) TaxID=1069680 RepID=M7NJR8_PNEMU|nr:hypothetical protein PNEG_02644 [Pneumocystis murina B123]EMR08858.1 hypothetical protein PNEG_02644 [Pneumocystis murina B123]